MLRLVLPIPTIPRTRTGQGELVMGQAGKGKTSTANNQRPPEEIQTPLCLAGISRFRGVECFQAEIPRERSPLLEAVIPADIHRSLGRPIPEDPCPRAGNPAGVGGRPCLQGAAPECPCATQGMGWDVFGTGIGKDGMGRAKPLWGAAGKSPGKPERVQRSQSHQCTELHVLSCGSRGFPVGSSCWDEPIQARERRKGSRKGERAPSHLNCGNLSQLRVSYPRTASVTRGAQRSSQDAPAGNTGGISSFFLEMMDKTPFSTPKFLLGMVLALRAFLRSTSPDGSLSWEPEWWSSPRAASQQSCGLGSPPEAAGCTGLH